MAKKEAKKKVNFKHTSLIMGATIGFLLTIGTSTIFGVILKQEIVGLLVSSVILAVTFILVFMSMNKNVVKPLRIIQNTLVSHQLTSNVNELEEVLSSLITSKQDAFNDSVALKNSLNEFIVESMNVQQNIESGEYLKKYNQDDYTNEFNHLAQILNNTFIALTRQYETTSNPIVTVDQSGMIRYANTASGMIIGIKRSDMLNRKYAEVMSFRGTDLTAIQAIKTGETFISDVCIVAPDGNKYSVQVKSSPLTNSEGEVVGAYEVGTDQTAIRNAHQTLTKQSVYLENQVNQLFMNIDRISKAQFDLDVQSMEYDEDTAEIHALFEQINARLNSSSLMIRKYVKSTANVLSEIAASNLNITIEEEFIGEFKVLKDELIQIIESLNSITMDINNLSNNVAQTSQLISESSQSLSQGTTEQAASIEEISATITQVSNQVKDNSDRVNRVNQLATESKEAALICDNLMQRMTTSMEEINDSSENISKVLKMINDIAFQTNILSLNAAVEAARAGQHGKGFAVIAEDVRNLALKSANAADETSDMIDEIIKKIKMGSDIANSTAESLRDILDGASNVARISKEVAVATNEQSTAISQINQSIDQISDVIQATSANAQQGVTSSKELSIQAKHLIEVVSRFNLKSGRTKSASFTRYNETKSPEVSKMFKEEFKVKENDPIRIILDENDFGKY